MAIKNDLKKSRVEESKGENADVVEGCKPQTSRPDEVQGGEGTEGDSAAKEFNIGDNYISYSA